ncbi:hypothetical protein [uncultured Winogradskyella sp.]|uniref:SPW repeat domain-containing protein n=1 Tax=uncultured Winogradskyella sp. TaxID=395353 RepID=UPI00263048D5|nr:hypothetical protein [uncultured Winogradskyella sp.]
MKFITKKIHSYLDYPVAISLIALPFLLNLGESNPIAFYLSVVVGVAALILTILTDHQTGLIPVISYRLHLLVDGAVAVLFILAPFIFSFEGIDAYFYWINGAAVLLVVSLHKKEVEGSFMQA